MFLKGAGLCLCVLALWSCGHRNSSLAAQPAPTAAPTPEDPERRLYEQIRTGAYQLNGALDNLQTAQEMAKKLSKVAGGTAGRGFTDLIKKLNQAGEDIADYTSEVPSFDQFKTSVAQEDDQRLDAIDDSNDALGYIADAQDIVENLLAGAPDEAKPQVRQIQDQLDECVDAMESAIVEMGGKVDQDDDTPQSGAAPANGAG